MEGITLKDEIKEKDKHTCCIVEDVPSYCIVYDIPSWCIVEVRPFCCNVEVGPSCCPVEVIHVCCLSYISLFHVRRYIFFLIVEYTL